jgi:polysaccharide pyruvyl transferase WcaK-like protein
MSIPFPAVHRHPITPRLRRLSRYARAFAGSRRRAAYLGWLNHENVGDEAMYEAYQRALPRCQLIEIPERVQRLTGPARRLAAVDAIVLGGGTLIGRYSYREAFERLSAAAPDAPAVMLGTGVEDPAFFGASKRERGDELRLWADVLPRFASVDVRGPRSQELLADLGIQAQVVGDSALMLGLPSLAPEPSDRVLGINLSVGMDIWGGRPGELIDTVAASLSQLIDDGWRVRFFPLWPPDLESATLVQRALGREIEVVDAFLDVPALLRALTDCRIFVGQKLHSVVLASAVHVPSISLEYHPKCRDFQRSIDRERWTVRTDEITADTLTSLVVEADEGYDADRDAIFASVTELRQRLADSAERARKALPAGLR